MIRTVENALLAPLRKALTVWMEDTSHLEGERTGLELLKVMTDGISDPHALMPIASLDTSLERVDNAIAAISKPYE
jgi:hypothetical protein